MVWRSWEYFDSFKFLEFVVKVFVFSGFVWRVVGLVCLFFGRVLILINGDRIVLYRYFYWIEGILLGRFVVSFVFYFLL